jgi:hypothetical protein
MEIIFIIIAVVIFLNGIAKKAKQEEAKRAAAERAAAERRTQAAVNDPARPRMTPERQVPVFDPRFPPSQSFEGTAGQYEGTAQAPGKAAAAFYGEGSGSGTESDYAGSMPGTAEERKVKLRDPVITARVSYKGDLHVVRSTSEGAHTHQETSMTGNTDKCPPTGEEDYKATPVLKVGGLDLQFGPSSIKQGILYSEILGKPRALRR